MLDRIDKILLSHNVISKNIYTYGSRLYGTFNNNSDYDFIVVGHTDNPNIEIRDRDVNVHIYSPESYRDMLDRNKITPLECEFLPSDFVLKKEIDFSFKIKTSALRHEISSKASNSWVKCKKKLTVEPPEARIIGLKSLFHSFRILLFGIQIARENRIYDYSEANPIYHEIMEMKDSSWDDLKDHFKDKHNKLFTEFRKLAPKG